MELLGVELLGVELLVVELLVVEVLGMEVLGVEVLEVELLGVEEVFSELGVVHAGDGNGEVGVMPIARLGLGSAFVRKLLAGD